MTSRQRVEIPVQTRMRDWILPFVLASILTLLNAVKPAVVDDTAYLLFARNIAEKPLDPYGFELFWYSHPQPAMQVLAPPVVPYWLALGVSFFGEHLFLLKLWLFPFSVLLCASSRSLLRRIAGDYQKSGLTMLILGAGVLPLFNFMLDIPALALGVTAVALFIQATVDRHWGKVLVSGILLGLALQTKYTMLTLPAVILWYGLLNRRVFAASCAIAVSLCVFAAWELFLHQKYGVSHFWFHVRDQGVEGNWLLTKLALFRPFLGHIGGLALGWALFVGRGVGLSSRFVMGLAAVTALGWIVVAMIPSADLVLMRDEDTGRPKMDLPAVVFNTPGVILLVLISVAIGMIGFRPRGSPLGLIRYSRAGWFLIGWLAIEFLGHFALTPFPAGRRVVPYCFVVGLLACHWVSRIQRIRPEQSPERWIPVFSVVLSLALMALDVWDALPERQLATRAVEITHPESSHQVWTQGHWGWQYYCDRSGMKLVVPGHSKLKTGDWLVVPVLPDETGFYRPYHGEAKFTIDSQATELVTEITWLDPIAGQTIPNLYGGNAPILGRRHPRLRIAIYRVTQDWVP